MQHLTGQKTQDGLHIWVNTKRKTLEDRLMNLMLKEPPHEDEDDEDDELDF